MLTRAELLRDLLDTQFSDAEREAMWAYVAETYGAGFARSLRDLVDAELLLRRNEASIQQ